MKKKIIFLLSLILFTASFSRGTGRQFSRSHWIAERMQSVWFSGGVLPLAERREFLFVEPLDTYEQQKAFRLNNIRVSQDVLTVNQGAAQPETQTEVMIAADPENGENLAAGYQEDRFNDGGSAALTFASSGDAGRRWSERLVPKLTIATGGAFDRASDPWIAYGLNHHVYYVSIVFNQSDPLNGVYLSISNDGGNTFGDPVTVAESTDVFNDKESVAVDKGMNSPFRGNVYVGWDSVAADNTQIALIARSTNGGASFSQPRKLMQDGQNIGVVPVVASNGTLYAFWVQLKPDQTRIFVARSRSGGSKWSPPHRVAKMTVSEVPGLRTGSVLMAPAVDPGSGVLYVVWQDKQSGSTVQIVCSRSLNQGKTWSVPVRVTDGSAQHHYFTPAVTVDDSGILAVSYYSIRIDPDGGHFVDLYISKSSDEGRTFDPPVRVTSRSFDVRFAANVLLPNAGTAFFLGDYQGIVSGPQFLHPVWVATLKNSRIDPSLKQPDVFTARVRR